MSHAADEARATNNAEGHARVGQQIGHVGTYIRKVVHHNNTYQDSGLSPEKTFEAACEYLAAGAAAKAAELIEEALSRKFRSAQVAYYWQLALLAGRPFDHLSHLDLDRIERARELAQEKPDEWTEAVRVIDELLECFSAQVQAGEEDDTYRFDRTFAQYEALPEARRQEMGRHLALLFGGGLQNRLDLERRRQIEQNRMGRDRRVRVPMFFEPDPTEPRLRRARRPSVGPQHWGALVAGSIAFAFGSAVLLSRAWDASPLKASALGSVFVLGCLGLVLLGPGFAHRRAMKPSCESRWLFRMVIHQETIEVQTRDIDALIDEHLSEVAPADPIDRTRFYRDVGPERTVLSETLHDLYASDKTKPVAAQQIDWLIQWHTDRMHSSWAAENQGTRVGPKLTAAERKDVLLAVSAAFVVGAASLQTITIPHPTFGATASTFGAYVLLVLGIASLAAGAPVHTEPRRFREEQADNLRLLDEELAAWKEAIRRLSDRPRDAEMAEWLDYDKDHIRLTAMKDWSLRNGNIVAQVVQTEPHPESASARVDGGPRRYAQYIVRLFLLTDNGVRALDVHLDFVTGAENKQQRHAFRYDAIASARIEELTVRRHGRRQIASPTGGGPRGVNRPIRRQALHLTLLSGEEFDINADYERLLADEDLQDNEKLLELEMQTSGAVSTLRTLESVAGEGREWISRERERNRRTASSYQRTSEPTPESSGDPTAEEEVGPSTDLEPFHELPPAAGDKQEPAPDEGG